MVSLVVGKSSYCLLSEANTYLDGSALAASLWIGVAPDDKKRAMITAWREFEDQRYQGSATAVTIVDSVSVTAGGSSHAADDVLTVAGGTFGEAAQVKVLTVAAGVVQTVELLHAGTYTAEPTSPASTTSSGSGTGCTLTLVFTDQLSDWPRTGMINCDGDSDDSDTYPQNLKDAQFVRAFEISQDTSEETKSGTGSNVRAVGAGSAKVEFFRATDGAGETRFSTAVMEKIGCYFESSTPSSFGTASGTAAESAFTEGDDTYGLTQGF